MVSFWFSNTHMRLDDILFTHIHFFFLNSFMLNIISTIFLLHFFSQIRIFLIILFVFFRIYFSNARWQANYDGKNIIENIFQLQLIYDLNNCLYNDHLSVWSIFYIYCWSRKIACNVSIRHAIGNVKLDEIEWYLRKIILFAIHEYLKIGMPWARFESKVFFSLILRYFYFVRLF